MAHRVWEGATGNVVIIHERLNLFARGVPGLGEGVAEPASAAGLLTSGSAAAADPRPDQGADLLVLRCAWTGVVIGLAGETGLVLLRAVPPVFLLILAISAGIPLLAATLWVRINPQCIANRYVVSLGILIMVTVINLTMNDPHLFYLYLFSLALATIYDDRRLVLVISLAAPVAYALVLYLHPLYLVPGSQLTNVTSDLVAIYSAFAIGPFVFDALAGHLREHRQALVAQEAVQERMRYLASHDHLTGVANRRYFEEEFGRQMEYAARYETAGAVLFLDGDDFKCINDTNGHHMGDLLLAALAERLKERLRSTDTLARLGGDEFAILIPQADAAAAVSLAQGVVRSVGDREFVIDGQPIAFTVSVGVALFPHGSRSVAEVLRHADVAMYRAKQMGCNGVCLYSPRGAPNLAGS